METDTEYFNRMDDEEARNEEIAERAEDISIELRCGHIVKVNGSDANWHIEDFIADDVFDTGSFCSFLTSNCEDLRNELNEKFEEWCAELATMDVDNEEPPIPY